MPVPLLMPRNPQARDLRSRAAQANQETTPGLLLVPHVGELAIRACDHVLPYAVLQYCLF